MNATTTELNLRSREDVERDPQPGDIYYSSWGYDQTNIDYFQVVKRTPGTVTIRSIGAELIGRQVHPIRDHWIVSSLLSGNDYSAHRERGYSEKVCRLKTQVRKWEKAQGITTVDKPGQYISIKSYISAWPYEGGGRYDTIAAGEPGH